MQQRQRRGHQGASIHMLRRPSSRESKHIGLAFQISNFAHIALAYGADAAQAALAHATDLLREIVGDAGVVASEAGGRFTVLISDLLALGPPLEGAPHRFITSFSATLAETPFAVDGNAIHIAVLGVRAGNGLSGTPTMRAPFPTVGEDEAWAARYRADMVGVAQMFALLVDKRLVCAWHAIRSASPGRHLLYYECLLRTIGDTISDTAPAQLIGAMERTGFITYLDRHVVSNVLTELEADPEATLGVNISAHSAWLSDWWEEIIARLQVRRDIAHRLVIEITETAPLPSITMAVAFCDRMRQLGCRIAIDDFGVGHTSIRNLIALTPAIVKLDRFFMLRAEVSERDRKALTHLAGLAATLAPIVVAEGVETQAQSRIAAEAGADWQQGDFHGRSTFMRPRWGAPPYEPGIEDAFNVPLGAIKSAQGTA